MLCQLGQDREGTRMLLLLLLLLLSRGLCVPISSRFYVLLLHSAFFFISSCIVFGRLPEHVVVAQFSVIDQRKSSQLNKEHVQTSCPPLPLVRETRTQAKGNNDTSPYRPPNISAKIYRPGPGRPEYLLQSVLSFTFRRGQGPALSVCIDSFFNSLVCRMIRLSCSLKWLAIREYLWPRNEGDYGGGGGRGGELESLFVLVFVVLVFSFIQRLFSL